MHGLLWFVAVSCEPSYSAWILVNACGTTNNVVKKVVSAKKLKQKTRQAKKSCEEIPAVVALSLPTTQFTQ